jgi:RNA polymerase-binding transcription factor DksA
MTPLRAVRGPNQSGRSEDVLNELDDAPPAPGTAVDPVEEPRARACTVCGEPVADPRRRACPGPCRTARQSRLQKMRRARRRG